MCRGAWNMLGGFMVFCAVCFLAITPALGAGMLLFVLFCGVAAVACFSTGSHPVTIRIIGGVVFLVCLIYLVSTIRTPMGEGPPQAARSGKPPILLGFSCFALIGLPAGYAAITGRYPGWGRGAEAFQGPSGKKKKQRASGPRAIPPSHPRRL